MKERRQYNLFVLIAFAVFIALLAGMVSRDPVLLAVGILGAILIFPRLSQLKVDYYRGLVGRVSVIRDLWRGK